MIVVIIIVAFIFWLRNQHQKSKPDFIRDNELIYEYMFPFALPSEVIKTIIILKVSKNIISISWEGDTIYFNINKTIKDAFNTQYECLNSHNEFTLITIFDGGVRVQDFQRGTDMKFTKTPPNPITSKKIDTVLDSNISRNIPKEVNKPIVNNINSQTSVANTNNPPEKSNNNLIIFFLIIFALIIWLVISEKNNQNTTTEFPTETLVDTSEANVETSVDTTVSVMPIIEKNESKWLDLRFKNFSFQLPENIEFKDNFSDENKRTYIDYIGNICVTIDVGHLSVGQENTTIKSLINDDIYEFALSINKNNKINFNDFSLIDYKYYKLGNSESVLISQESTDVSGTKNIEIDVLAQFVVSFPYYYSITFSYPKNSTLSRDTVDKIMNSFIFD